MAKTTKTGGRSKGTPNKVTNDLRENFTLLLEANFEKLQSDIDALEPKDRIKTILELSKFVIPTLKASDLTIDANIKSEQPLFPDDYSEYSTEDLLLIAELDKKYEKKKD